MNLLKLVPQALRTQAPLEELDHHLFADERAVNPLDALVAIEDLTRLHQAIATLDPREQLILRHRYGLDGTSPRTLIEVGELIGLTRERVRQIEMCALTKLRCHLSTPDQVSAHGGSDSASPHSGPSQRQRVRRSSRPSAGIGSQTSLATCLTTEAL